MTAIDLNQHRAADSRGFIVVATCWAHSWGCKIVPVPRPNAADLEQVALRAQAEKALAGAEDDDDARFCMCCWVTERFHNPDNAELHVAANLLLDECDCTYMLGVADSGGAPFDVLTLTEVGSPAELLELVESKRIDEIIKPKWRGWLLLHGDEEDDAENAGHLAAPLKHFVVTVRRVTYTDYLIEAEDEEAAYDATFDPDPLELREDTVKRSKEGAKEITADEARMARATHRRRQLDAEIALANFRKNRQ